MATPEHRSKVGERNEILVVDDITEGVVEERLFQKFQLFLDLRRLSPSPFRLCQSRCVFLDVSHDAAVAVGVILLQYRPQYFPEVVERGHEGDADEIEEGGLEDALAGASAVGGDDEPEVRCCLRDAGEEDEADVHVEVVREK